MKLEGKDICKPKYEGEFANRNWTVKDWQLKFEPNNGYQSKCNNN